MKRERTAFLLTGLIAGLIAAVAGKLTPTALTVGVGPLLFAAIVSGIAITGTARYLPGGVWRYLFAALLSTVAYALALYAFSLVMGYSPQWFGVQQSSDIVAFRLDVWLGLIAAAAVASVGIVSLGAVLTGRWSMALFARLIAAGLITVVITFLANMPFHQYWSFIGVMLPIGSALFCWLVGAEIWSSTEHDAQV